MDPQKIKNIRIQNRYRYPKLAEFDKILKSELDLSSFPATRLLKKKTL